MYVCTSGAKRAQRRRWSASAVETANILGVPVGTLLEHLGRRYAEDAAVGETIAAVLLQGRAQEPGRQDGDGIAVAHEDNVPILMIPLQLEDHGLRPVGDIGHALAGPWGAAEGE